MSQRSTGRAFLQRGWLALVTVFAEEALFWKAGATGQPVPPLMPAVRGLPDGGADANLVVA